MKMCTKELLYVFYTYYAIQRKSLIILWVPKITILGFVYYELNLCVTLKMGNFGHFDQTRRVFRYLHKETN